jgi:hypothetical protein
MQIHRAVAERLVAKMKVLHSQPLRLVPVSEADFAHLDFGSYRYFRSTLEAHGYRFLGDFESLAVSESPDSPLGRTMMRSMLSADGCVAAVHYQVRPKMERLVKTLIKGVLNLRLLDAPAHFFKHLPTRQIYDFVSEVGGHYVLTSSAEAVGKFGAPASIDAKYLATGTPLEEVRAAHMGRLAVAQQRATATVMTSHDDAQAMHERMRLQKAAHRAASGWLTRDELLRFTKGNIALTDSIFEEVQAILQT